MKVAAIITEYNPFHKGHEYQINKTREILGEDTAIIAIMSGNYTQRGEIAVTDKTIRARAAVECGVNLVLELPFPYSMSSAEFFASAGVHIANRLGVVDYLVFGSELGEADTLTQLADMMQSEEFIGEVRRLLRERQTQNLGYPKIVEMATCKVFNEAVPEGFFTPNNILALEYLKALKRDNSKIQPLTIKRVGAGYTDGMIAETELQSASAIRNELSKNDNSALDFVPENAKKVFLEAIKNGKMPSDPERLDVAVISHFRLNSPDGACNIHDADGGLYNRLITCGEKANSISSLVEMSATKRYTNARIKRAIFYSYFGVTSSDVRTLPLYTQVLALDSIGRSLLQRIKKMSDFYIVTKPSRRKSLSELAVRQKELSNKADAVFGLTLKEANPSAFALSFSPYVKK